MTPSHPVALVGLPGAVLQTVLDPATRTVAVVALGLLALLAISAATTLYRSVREWRRDRRRRAIEEAVGRALDDRLGRDDVDVATWVVSLSSTEREILVEVLERYLAFVDGRDRETLLELADALDIEHRALRAIESGSRHERLRGLRRLALLGRSVDADWLLPRLSGTPAEREAAAPVVAIECQPDRRVVVELLLSGGPLSVFGLDALHGVVEPDPAPLLRWLAETPSEDPTVLARALLVLERVETVAHDASLSGVLDSLDHDDERVRELACYVLAAYRWREELPDRVDVDSLLADPSPGVRIAVYRMLDEWGELQSRAELKRVLREESDDRARLVLARALDRTPPGTIVRFLAGDPVSEETAAWATEEATIVRRTDPLG